MVQIPISLVLIMFPNMEAVPFATFEDALNLVKMGKLILL
ncbi:hypothetical protein HNQ69_000520 [Bartonella callosciuri]|uniref:Uncharacterized protein n=1 Tax=Bartonella callosciuri TaxID=686223 RepID=A0A840NVV6_9HYPH|nr:hypothetical protein [Bartonella callosciuri]